MQTSASFDHEIKKNFRFNFTVNLLDVAFYMFGSSFMSIGTILPAYVTHFTQNPVLIGLIAFFGSAGYLLPQLLTSNLVERAPVKKFFPVNIGFFTERVPVFLLVPTTFFLATRSPDLALVAFFVLLGWWTLGAGVVMVGWQDMIAKIIPVVNRGRFFGLSNFIGNFAGILGATTVAWLLWRFAFPTGFVIAFAISSVCTLISWIFLGLSREPRDPVSKPVVSSVEYFKALPAVIRSNKNFENFLIAQMVSAFGALAAGFLIVHGIERWRISDGQAASFGIALLLAQSLANLGLGFLADRKGHKLVLEITIAMSVASFVAALFAPDPAWFYLVFALRGVVGAGNFVSGMSLPLEFSKPQDRPTYIGLASTLPGIAGAVAPMVAGGMAAFTGYPALFLASAVISAGAFGLMRWVVKDPRHVPILVTHDD